GEVVDNGGGLVSARGVVWSTNDNPTTDVNEGMTTDGSGIGSFTSELTGLSAGTNYYVRAYATNEAGTAYGTQETFSTVSAVDGIVSTEAGGNWNDASTWIGGVVPGTDDNVVVNGRVSVAGNYSCKSLQVAETGSLQNANDLQGYSLEVNGHLMNEGIIQDNPDFSTSLNIIVHGDVSNSATISVGELSLAGENGHAIFQSGNTPFTVGDLKMWFNATGPVTFGNDVTFEGTNIALGNVDANLSGPLNLTGGAVLSDVILNGQGNVLSGQDNAILSSDVILSNVNLSGNLQITGNLVSFGEGVVIQGTVENGDNFQGYTLEATGDLINEGILRNNPDYGTALNVRVYKNVTNSGTIGVQQFYVDGETGQSITLMNESGIDSEVFFYSNMETGGPYQWQKDGVAITDATSDFLKFENGLSSADAGVYTCISDGTESRSITVEAETSTVDALPLPFNDGFEDGTEGWLIIDYDGDDNQWERSYGSAYEGDYAFRVYYNSLGNNDWLVSPLLNLPENALSVDLSFFARSDLSSMLESFDVKVITEDETIHEIASEVEVPDNYTEYTYDLTEFAGQKISVAVVCVSEDKFYLYLDKFSITAETPTSVIDRESKENVVEIYPNPATETSVVRIDLADSRIIGVELLSITGQIVKAYSMSGSSGIERINVTGQKPGVYFLKIYTSNGEKVKKLIIQ
ncbi:MAG: choice-of-anchor J domain-containing protein, partial [Bacteroidota bacterium]